METALGDFIISRLLSYLVIIILFFSYFFFFPSKFCLNEFSVITEQIVLRFPDMVYMDVKLCNRVSKFKMLDSKAGPRVCPKLPTFYPDYFSLTVEGIVLIFF